MRHRKSGRKFNINGSHRKALLTSLANSLVKYEIIKTTLPKAKEIRGIVEPLITLAKNDTVASRRLVFSKIRDRSNVTKLFDDISVRSKDRPGGYLRILKCGYRSGDSAPMAYIELVDRETSPE